jgi:predicted deacylase
MVPGEVALVRQPLFFERTEVIRSPATGVWHPRVERGQSVQKGGLIGILTDFFGEQLAEIRAPFGGIVLYVVGTPAMSQGEPMGMIGEPRLER